MGRFVFQKKKKSNNVAVVTVATDECRPKNNEKLYNYSFDCDGKRWTAYNAVVTYSDSKANVERTGLSGSTRQKVNLTANEMYNIEVNVLATSSSTFVSVTNPSGDTSYPLDYLDVGIHKKRITATESGSHIFGVGNNNPVGST